MTSFPHQRRNDSQAPRKLKPPSWTGLVRLAKRERRNLVAVTALAAGLSLGLLFTLPDSYVATTTIQLDPKRGPRSNDNGTGTAAASSDAAVAARALVDIRSHEVALAVVARLDLQDRPEFFEGATLWQRISATLASLRARQPGEANGHAANQTSSRFAFSPEANLTDVSEMGTIDPRMTRAAAILSARLTARRLRNTLLIAITIEASEPALAAHIADTVANVFISRKLARKKEAAEANMRSAERRIAELRTELVAARRAHTNEPDTNADDSPTSPSSDAKIDALSQQLETAMKNARQAGTNYGLHLPDARIVEQAVDQPARHAPRTRAVVVSLITSLTCALVLVLALAFVAPRRKRATGNWPPAYIDAALSTNQSRGAQQNMKSPLSASTSRATNKARIPLRRST